MEDLMLKNRGNVLLVALAVLNLLVFSGVASMEVRPAAYEDGCNTQCCLCFDGHGGELSPLCMELPLPCDQEHCVFHHHCEPQMH